MMLHLVGQILYLLALMRIHYCPSYILCNLSIISRFTVSLRPLLNIVIKTDGESMMQLEHVHWPRW